jgi:hypothetical protein
MSKNPFEKLADKLLHRDKKGNDLKKYNIDLNGVFGGGVNNKEIEYDSYRKLIGTAKTCLSGQLHFWLAKKQGDHSSRIKAIERDFKISAAISERINKKTYTPEDIKVLKDILSKYGCLG